MVATAQKARTPKLHQSVSEEDELRTLRVHSGACRGDFSPSKNSYLPSLQGESLEQTLRDAARSPVGSRGRMAGSAPASLGGTAISVQGFTEGADGSTSRGKAPTDQVMTSLSAEVLEAAKQEFMARGGSLTLDEFVKATLRCMDAADREARGSIRKLSSGIRFQSGGGDARIIDPADVDRAAAVIGLFRSVDVHGEGSISWEEMSNYMIEAGLEGSEQFTVDSIKTYEISPIADQSKHDSNVERLKYIAPLDSVVCLSQSSRSFRLYEPHRLTLRHEVAGHRGSVINCCYVEGWNQLATTSADMTICMWDTTNYVLRNRITTKDVQLCAEWDARSRSLYSGSIDGTLSRWSLDHMCLADARRGQHNKAINDLLMVDDINLLASASSDGSILMWDTELLRPKKAFKGHKKGTFSLAYSNEYRCLLTAGLDQEALVWNPYVEKVPIFRLRGHTHSLCGIAVVPGTPQILSADVAGTIRLWDMRNFRCVQSFGGPDTRGNDLNSFCMMPPHRRLVAGGCRLVMYDYMDEAGGENITDTAGVAESLYNPNAGEFYTCSKRSVKVWSAESGGLFKVMRDIAQQEITAACLADIGHKMYLGDAAGRVAAHSLNTGRVLTEFFHHSTDISSLAVWRGTKMLISSSWDGVVKVQADMASRRPQIIAEFHHHRDGVTCVSCCPELMLLATGGTDMQVVLYDLKTLKLEKRLDKLPHVVAGLDFLPARCLLAVADQGGILSLWRVRPHPDKWTRVHYLRNFLMMPSLSQELQLPISSTAQQRPAIPFSAVLFAAPPPGEPPVPRLYTADTKGRLRCWDITALLERRNIVDCDLLALFEQERVMQLRRAQGGHNFARRASTAFALDASIGRQGSLVRGAAGSPDGGAFITALGGDDEGRQEDPSFMLVRDKKRRGTGPAADPGAGGTAGPDVQLLWEAEGHADAVLSLHIGSGPWAVLTCGQDRRVRTWDSHLENLGDLLQSKDPKYRFPYDKAGAHERRLAEARELLRRVEPWTWTPQQKLPALAASGTRSTPDLLGLDSFSGKKRPTAKKDTGALWRMGSENFASDLHAQGEDYQVLFSQMERSAVGMLPAPVSDAGSARADSAASRLRRHAGTRSCGHIPQRTTALTKEEATAADRLARAMAALGGDDFGTFSSMARNIRPKGRPGTTTPA